MKRLTTFLLVFTILLSMLPAAFAIDGTESGTQISDNIDNPTDMTESDTFAAGESGDVQTANPIINQIYGGGGKGETPISNSFIELYNPFADVKADAYYHDAVLWAIEQGITAGTGETTFSPDEICTRSQTVTFLYRSTGSPDPGTVGSFTDVATDSYYADAVNRAMNEGITAGTDTDTFSPDTNCTRAQIATFLYRFVTE